jgi:hypothetical protein
MLNHFFVLFVIASFGNVDGYRRNIDRSIKEFFFRAKVEMVAFVGDKFWTL